MYSHRFSRLIYRPFVALRARPPTARKTLGAVTKKEARQRPRRQKQPIKDLHVRSSADRLRIVSPPTRSLAPPSRPILRVTPHSSLSRAISRFSRASTNPPPRLRSTSSRASPRRTTTSSGASTSRSSPSLASPSRSSASGLSSPTQAPAPPASSSPSKRGRGRRRRRRRASRPRPSSCDACASPPLAWPSSFGSPVALQRAQCCRGGCVGGE